MSRTAAALESELTGTLKRVFGYKAFRPLQREIIEDFLAGKDVFALLPTGGGKSLCFQLPALHRPGLTVVVSPLIALMKDQVDALQAAGVSATYLNSTLEGDEAVRRFRSLYAGEYKLLYAAPERLMQEGFVDRLKDWNVEAIAIDEAHCVSEWGHDFRPEYRQLSALRAHLPGVPVMALTATATERVRADIVSGLQLDCQRQYVASFNRPNLQYRVIPRSKPYQQLLKFLESREDESGIIYCQSRKSAERIAEDLEGDGFEARPYHAGLDNAERAENQDLFLRDEVKIICATVAFGMGINKPNVRFVVHYDLPKNIEGYYQETGRAGRDGLASECLLLFSAADVVKYQQFIRENPDPAQQAIARMQLQQMVHYAESSICRRRSLLDYFGEQYTEETCGSCDNCLDPKETFDGTVALKKFLSCIYRIKEFSGFSVGMNHLVEVLTGADTEKIRRWGHEKLSTYGIGKDLSRPEWFSIGREMQRLGYVHQDAQKFGILEITESGWRALKGDAAVTLTKPTAVSERRKSTRRAGGEDDDLEYDTGLFAKLRALRKKLADERRVPPYIIFGDVSLRQMARQHPKNESQFSKISGVGEKKLKEFAKLFIREISAYFSGETTVIQPIDTRPTRIIRRKHKRARKR